MKDVCEEEAVGGGRRRGGGEEPGYRIKNKNPTQRCGGKKEKNNIFLKEKLLEQ